MPIKIGNTNIGAIYKGSTPIAKIYKGTTLLYENASWELFSQQYLYYTLIQQTINSKSVKNKAKISKIYGNGVIENQLVQNGNFESTTGWSSAVGQISIYNNILTITLTQNLNANEKKSVCVFSFFPVVNTNKYFISYQLKTSVAGSMTFDGNFSARATNSVSANIWNTFSSLSPATSNGNSNLYIQFRPSSNLVVGDTIQIKVVMVSNLTLREGTGNEPTTLTDNRIQNILNRGYIPYNLGKYKGTDIGEFSSEPYNLCDNDFENGFINNGSDLSISYCVRTPNTRPIEVLPNVSYTFSINSAQYKYAFIVEYDENMGFIKQNGATNNTSTTATMSANTKYIRLVYGDKDNTTITTIPSPSNSQPCLFRTGTRTGYAEHKTFTPITFKAQLNGAINSHDTMEITNTGYVFTKNVGSVDMGSIAWQYAGANIFYKDISNIKNTADNTLGNIITTIYTSVKRNDLGDKNICISGTSIITKDSAYTNASVYKTAMSGIYAYYPLATPQVITIPRKHLGCVDLGSLTYSEYGSTSDYTQYFTNGIDSLAKNNGNAYCSLFILQNTPRVAGTMFIGMGNGKTYFRTRVGEYANATDFKNAMAGQYLFYETQDEVADIIDTIDIESGGTITTDSDVLPNIELSVKCK